MDETTTTMIDSQEEVSGKKLGHPPKKRRTLDFFARHRGDPSNPEQHLQAGTSYNVNSSSNKNNNKNNNRFSCSGTTSTSTENLSLETRSRLDSSSSFSTASLSGLPAYIVDIPPIPSLHGLGCMDTDQCDGNKNDRGNKKTSTPSMRSLLAIRRYISQS
eukprot:CAMPEP_0116122000 /NCGR_PEP_ID=MMETSP0329-20121206/3987_1 /TAXON_ID=697910 /ORGANISM="Pseudo-nitzschia arenysensis, Strain B593" /LENGTH=159 /DNA_ID=CAMNT_0003615831 /DNA_START=390 /DNA_END=869 /DNA_ORIENTATION=-